MKRKILLLMLSPLVLAMMAFYTFTTFTDNQMKTVAKGIVDQFKYSHTSDPCYKWGTDNTCPELLQDSLIKTRLNLLDVLGILPDAVQPLIKGPKNQEWSREERDIYYTSRDSQKTVYARWVPWALRNRNLFITFWTESRATQFWKMVDESAVEQKLDYATRQRMFKEIGEAVLYYKQSLNSLNSTTSTNRREIFDLVAKISPRQKVYQLQEDLIWRSKVSELTTANDSLRKKLSNIGVVVPDVCHDFYDYKFTRYDRSYDYLFAIARWAARHDNGTITEQEISGYKTTTLDALVYDGKKLADVTYASLFKYQPKK